MKPTTMKQYRAEMNRIEREQLPIRNHIQGILTELDAPRRALDSVFCDLDQARHKILGPWVDYQMGRARKYVRPVSQQHLFKPTAAYFCTFMRPNDEIVWFAVLPAGMERTLIAPHTDQAAAESEIDAILSQRWTLLNSDAEVQTALETYYEGE